MIAIAVAVYVLMPQDGSGHEWSQECAVTPSGMRCVWYSGPPELAPFASPPEGVVDLRGSAEHVGTRSGDVAAGRPRLSHGFALGDGARVACELASADLVAHQGAAAIAAVPVTRGHQRGRRSKVKSSDDGFWSAPVLLQTLSSTVSVALA